MFTLLEYTKSIHNSFSTYFSCSVVQTNYVCFQATRVSLSHLVTWSREKIDPTSSMLENVVNHGIQLDLLLSVQEWALASTFNLQYAARHQSSMMTYYDVTASNRMNLVYPLSLSLRLSLYSTAHFSQVDRCTCQR